MREWVIKTVPVRKNKTAWHPVKKVRRSAPIHPKVLE